MIVSSSIIASIAATSARKSAPTGARRTSRSISLAALSKAGCADTRRHDVAAVLRVAALLARPVAAGLHRLDDAFGAAGGHEALPPPRAR